jgi:valyl-tRNA synthetase
MGLWFTDDIPFHTVYLHGLVRAEGGKKMSKSYGNVEDPLDIVAKYSTDALRLTLLTGSSPGNDMNLSESRIEYSRNFGNKLWQMSRFVWSNLDGYEPRAEPEIARLDLPSRWILSRLHSLIGNAQRLFDTYQYGEAGRQIIDFLWSEFADWYVESSKIALYGGDVDARTRTLNVLTHVLDRCLRLLHPYIPYITEEIWRYLPTGSGPLITAAWPAANTVYLDAEAEAAFAILMELVRGIRNARAEYKVEPGHKISAAIDPGTHRALINEQQAIFERLCNTEQIVLLDSRASVPDKAVTIVATDVTIYLPLADLVDLDAERERLRGELDNLDQQIARSKKLLANQDFVLKAKPDVVQRERDKLDSLTASRQAVDERLASLGD